MTEYTADDFKSAKYAARHRDGRTATRREQLGGWITSHGLRQNDQEMAGNGWVPAQEDPRTLTEDLVAAVVRAVEAEKERDEARKFATAEHVRTVKAEQERDEYRAMYSEQIKTIARLQKNPRPLTVDDITDEMVERAKRRPEQLDSQLVYVKSGWGFREILIAAFTPSRPEGAEEIESQIEAWSMSPDGGGLAATQHRTLADHLASRGVRATGKDN